MELTENEHQVINIITRDFCFKWPHIDREDLRQTLYEKAVREYEYLLKYRRMGYRGHGAMSKMLGREAQRYAEAEHAQMRRVTSTPEAKLPWTKEHVKRALPFIFENFDVGGKGVSDADWELYQACSKQDFLTTRGYNAEDEAQMLMHVIREGFLKLSIQQRTVLWYRFRDGLSSAEIAEIIQATENTVDKQVGRAIDALYRKMGTV